MSEKGNCAGCPLCGGTRTVIERVMYDGCPLCGGGLSPFRVGDCSEHHGWHPGISPQINWMSCGECGHICTDGYFEDPATNTGVLIENQVPGFNVESRRAMNGRMLDRVTRFVNEGKWLDVGCGAGHLMTTADEYGFDVVGCDIREQIAASLSAIGFPIQLCPFETLETDEQFDVISIADTLEHMPYPKAALDKARELLRPGGLLFISMPNAGCFAWYATDHINENPYWGELEHYHNFTRERLYALLRETGFTPKNYSVGERYRVCMEVIALAN